MTVKVAENSRTNLLLRSEKRKKAQQFITRSRYLFFNDIDTFVFSVLSVSRKRISHIVKIQIPSLIKYIYDNTVDDDERTDVYIIRQLLEDVFENNLKVYCDCEDFLYSGTKYYCYHNDAGIEPEDRKPQPDKEKRRSLLCKHLRYVLVYINRYNNSMSRDLVRYFSNKRKR